MEATEVLARAAELGYPCAISDGGAVATRAQWEAAASKPGNIQNLAAQLSALEADRLRRDELAEKHGIEDARRSNAVTLDIEASAQEQREAVDSLARYRAAAPDRLEALMHRQVALLEKLVSLPTK
jgi:hypothetical protein